MYQLSYNECREIIDNMKFTSASDLFGLERDKEALESTILTIYQAFDGQEFYSTWEAKAANLLFLLAKNHTCMDGNKRIAVAIFLHFMHKNQALFNENGNKRISDDAFVAITIMIAESKPDEKLQPMVAEISWTKNLVIMEKSKEDLEREFYIRMTFRHPKM